MENAEKMFLRLELGSLPKPKKNQRLEVRYNKRESELRSAARGFEVSVYDVLNHTHQSANEVELMSPGDGRKLGRCSCRSRYLCHHIPKAVALHVARKRAQLAADAQLEAERD